jgi:hypothetical protein
MTKELDDEYVFPDEQEEKKEVEASTEDDFEVEIEDDTPKEDRGRAAAEPPAEVTDDELAEYDEKVQKRLKKFTRGYHDERRAKEAALRERQAAEAFAKQVLEDNKKLQEQLAYGSRAYIDQSKSSAEIALDVARKKYRDAFEAGDADQAVSAQEEIARAMMNLDRAANMKPVEVEEREMPVLAEPEPVVDRRSAEWQNENEWFGKNRSMTAFALGLHAELVEERGFDPASDEYYEAIDKTMRQKFPEQFGSEEVTRTPPQSSEPAEEETPRRATKPAAVVAPATRSTPPNRIRLKKSEVDVARRLGVPIELYAKQVAKLKNGV